MRDRGTVASVLHATSRAGWQKCIACSSGWGSAHNIYEKKIFSNLTQEKSEKWQNSELSSLTTCHPEQCSPFASILRISFGECRGIPKPLACFGGGKLEKILKIFGEFFSAFFFPARKLEGRSGMTARVAVERCAGGAHHQGVCHSTQSRHDADGLCSYSPCSFTQQKAPGEFS